MVMTGFYVGPFATGFAVGGGLIIAIGAQNAFVLRQGLIGRHVLPLVLFCALSDAVLIGVGVAGGAAVVSSHRNLQLLATFGGALFLIWYGVSAWRRSLTTQTLATAAATGLSLRQALILCATFTWANPHVYLDTVVLVGSLAAAYPAAQRLSFGAGAALASFVWFFALGYGASMLRPVFAYPQTWVWLERLIAVVMFAIAGQLLFDLAV